MASERRRQCRRGHCSCRLAARESLRTLAGLPSVCFSFSTLLSAATQLNSINMAAQEGGSLVRQNYTNEVEAAVNKQINIELYASYVYLSMSFYFDRDDIALSNISKWMKKQSDEEREHAMMLMKFQNTRGGRIVLQNVTKPDKDEWGNALSAFEAALALEKFNNQSLLELHAIAGNNNDAQMCDFLEDKYLREQVESIEEIAKFITNLKRVGPGLGEYMFDKEHFDD
ncbi:hypothetical protein L596_007973 [Steinernema carpocapsae]|uniref:Ferritin n=2 Tax=Steinernema carpocapsae TaxID=34508 RepID=A0A4U5PBK1_STECR|nr:hypothetical protein L596_007973 [Steinernema carpocapsae]